MLRGPNSILETLKERAGKLEKINRKYPMWKTEKYFWTFKTEPHWPLGNVKSCKICAAEVSEKREGGAEKNIWRNNVQVSKICWKIN